LGGKRDSPNNSVHHFLVGGFFDPVEIEVHFGSIRFVEVRQNGEKQGGFKCELLRLGRKYDLEYTKNFDRDPLRHLYQAYRHK